MNIILGQSDAEKLSEKYIVLELDTITIKNSTPIVAYCIVESDKMPLDQIAQVADLKKVHTALMENYYQRNWNFCEQAIKKLTGFWGSQLDTFYASLLSRITEYKENEPDESWTGIVEKG